MKSYRDNGAIGALLDEYEKAIQELQLIIDPISKEELIKVVDKETKDPDCVSIQSILSHVIGSGYTYAIETRKYLGEEITYRETESLSSVAQYQKGLEDVFAYNVQLFKDYPNIILEEYDNTKKMKVRWGQYYDVEQIFEHAIVHVLRHRRQIERFILKMRS